ncbi:mitochondrial 37S ribosomal protein uS5m MRPS5 [Rhodotorula paludigena]|uniref:mitochondrial 37S ribosomal protein uS5m MRPS5 n=1 Tax=Rhodotorula paludigena TaxID=86838 RepID=UPI0031798537
MQSLRQRTQQLAARAWHTARAPAPAPAVRTFSSSPCTCSPAASSSPSATTTVAEPAGPALQRPDLRHPSLSYLQSLAGSDLSAFDPVLDIDPSKVRTLPALTPRTEKNPVRVTLINDTPNNAGFQQPRPSPDQLDGLPGEDDSVAHLAQVTQLSAGEIRNLYRFPLIVKRVVTMKSKGKQPSMYSLVVVGNGKGLVGAGEGKDETAQKATQKAFNQAVRSMDYVERYEDRTVWGTMRSNFGTCKLEMRSRPPGFGLRVNPYLHQVAKAAGISDLSAKVYGSRNPTRVIKLAVAMLHGGSSPLDMGGFGKEKGSRRNKKTKGMETAEAIGRARGRKAVDVSA